MTTPLHRLTALGQSVWLDDINRTFIHDGTLRRLIHHDGVSGVTSNPAIFDRAIASGSYDEAIRGLKAAGQTVDDIYTALVIKDIRETADLLHGVYQRSRGRDGLVSLEVSPRHAHDAAGTIDEARHLWRIAGRPNLMIKVPATPAGLTAIQLLTAEGVNVNATLLFSPTRCQEVFEAYRTGLEARIDAGHPVAGIASVASLFVSRIDTRMDKELDAADAAELRGHVAIAVAGLAYASYRESVSHRDWQRLAAHGAHPQRLLWASTGSKDPAYSDIKYVDALVAPDTVTTLPFETLNAYRDHGNPAVRIDALVLQAQPLLDRVRALGIDPESAFRALESAGIRQFVEACDRILRQIEARCQAVA